MEARQQRMEAALLGRQEQLFWWLAALPGEDPDQTRRRVFRRMPPARGGLRAVQLGNLAILRELRELCARNGLEFCLAAGTLLGAVRHGGFVPWDDDVDIYMPHAHLCRLGELLRDHPRLELNPYFTTRRTAYSFDAWQTYKVTFRGLERPFWADVFALDFVQCPPEEKDRRWGEIRAGLEAAARQLAKTARRLPYPYYEEPIRDPAHRRRVEETLEKAMAPLPREERGDWVYLGRDGHFVWWPELYPAGKIFPLGELEFEGEPVPVPRDPEGMLRKAYGDFWALPGDFAAGHPGMVPPEFTEERLRELLERVLESPFEKQGGTENDHREETGPAGGDDGAARRLPDAGNRP